MRAAFIFAAAVAFLIGGFAGIAWLVVIWLGGVFVVEWLGSRPRVSRHVHVYAPPARDPAAEQRELRIVSWLAVGLITGLPALYLLMRAFG
jgi:hypothetical protein